jgi:predicted P-loop ATPase
VEGPPKADALWDLDLPAVAFPNGFKETRDSRWFEGYEDRLIVVPDRDKPGVDKATRIGQAYPMARQLKPWPESCWWDAEWLPANGGRDILDWITEMRSQGLGDEEIKKSILSAIETAHWNTVIDKTQIAETQEPEELPRQLRDYETIKARLGNDLRYNELTKVPELKGIPFELADAKLTFAIEHRLKLRTPDETVARICDRIAREQSYSPVRDYLEELPSQPPDLLSKLASHYLGTDDLLHATMLRRTLISGVARAYEPGCKVDTMPILTGKQADGIAI